jgi:hypothetical protein
MNKLCAKWVLMGLLFLPSTASQASAVFHPEDYGAVADGQSDAAPAIRQAIAAAMAAGFGSTVVFQPGTYLLKSPAHLLPKAYDYCLTILNAKGLTLKGDRSRLLVADPTAGGVVFSHSDDCKIQGLSLDYDSLPFTQGEVLQTDPAAGSFDLCIQRGYDRPDLPRFQKFGKWGFLFDPQSRLSKAGFPQHLFLESLKQVPHAEDLATVHRVAGRPVFRLTVKEEYRPWLVKMAPGDLFVLLARREGEHAFTWVWCDRPSMENVEINASPACAVVALGCSRFHVSHLKVDMPPHTDRLISTDADGVHCQQNRVGPTIEFSYFRGMADDGINIYCPPDAVLGVEGKRLRVDKRVPIRPGDRVELFEPLTGKVLAETKVDSVEEKSGAFLLTLADNVDLSASGLLPPASKERVCLFDKSASGEGYVIAHNTFTQHRRYGTLLRAGHGLVEDNRYIQTSGAGICIANEPDWPEGPVPSHIELHHNVIQDCAYGAWFSEGAVKIVGSKLGNQPADADTVSDILLWGNKASGKNAGLYVKSAKNLKLVDNHFSKE